MKTTIKVLLVCGILSSLLYVATDIFSAVFLYPGYSYSAQQVSELSAIGAPTRPLWVVMSFIYAPLVAAFGFGVLRSAGKRRARLVTGALLFVFAAVGLTWGLVAPMHMRGTVGFGATTDVMHLVFAAAQVILMIVFISLGAASLGRGFRIYSVVTIVAMLTAGAIVGQKVGAIAAGESTPGLGLLERVSVYAPMLWIAVFALSILKEQGYLKLKISGQSPPERPRPADGSAL